MSEFKQTTVYEDIPEGYFYWTKIQTPDYGYNPNKLPIAQLDPQEQKYKVEVCVSKEVYTDFVKKYPKKKTTPFENDAFLEKYKVTEVPYPNQPLQYVLIFKQKVIKKDGSPMPDSLRPKVWQFVDGVQQDVTMTTLVGNGSKGRVRYAVWTFDPNFAPQVNLFAICVDNLVPYTAPKKPKRVDNSSFSNVD